jgi:formate-dependent nitrite reductase membrane component NrfD
MHFIHIHIHLHFTQTLTILYLFSGAISDAGAEYLAQAIQNNQVTFLQMLYISYIFILIFISHRH